MTRAERTNWLTNLHNTADEVAAEYGWDLVKGVLSRFNATSIENLSPSDYEEVFSELYLIATDN